MNHKNIAFRIVMLSMAFLFFVLLSGCSSKEAELRTEEAERALASLDNSRPENARLLPDFSGTITDIRMNILDREYYVPSFEEDFQNLSMMQIWYGYCSDGTWYDYPSENYDLIGILENEDYTGWRAALGSHMVKIGPYLLISICAQDHPMKECVISDSLGSQPQEPFVQYNTYHYYYDENGEKHSFMDINNHGYGFIAENPTYSSNSEDTAYAKRCEFMQRFYLILDYESIPANYELMVSITGGNTDRKEIYTLSADTIKEQVG